MSDNRQAALIAEQMAKPGMRGKINAKCIECIYVQGEGGGSWRAQVEACTAISCPLFSIRPTQMAVKQPTGREQPEQLRRARMARQS